MEQFGWAFLGCGGIAHTVARQILRDKSCKIISCWNRTASRATDFAARYGATAYATPREAATAEGVKGVYVAVTHDAHMSLVEQCIELGVPVLCEKPMTVNAAGAQYLFDLAERRGVYLAEAMWTWFNSPARKVRDWLRAGSIGNVKEVTATYALPVFPPLEKPRLSSPEMIGGSLLDIGIYPVRYVYELFGMPSSVTCRGKLRGGVDLTERIVMDYGSFAAKIFISRRLPAGERLVIKGTEGKIAVPFFHMASHACISGRVNERFSDHSLKYATQFRLAAKEISSGQTQSAYSPAQSTICTMKLLDECRAQMGLVYPCERTDKDGALQKR